MVSETILEDITLSNGAEGYYGLSYHGSPEKLAQELVDTTTPFIELYTPEPCDGTMTKIVIRKDAIVSYSYEIDEPYINLKMPALDNLYSKERQKAGKQYDNNIRQIVASEHVDEKDLQEYLIKQIQIAFGETATDEQIKYFTAARKKLGAKIQKYIDQHDDINAMILFGDDLDYGITDILVDVLFIYAILTKEPLDKCISSHPVDELVKNGWQSFLNMENEEI